jgi:predicted PurR-regulated permease PerM
MAQTQNEPIGRDQLATTLLELVIRLAILAFFVYWAVLLVRPFLTVAIWSMVLAVALYPVFEWLASRLGGRRRLAAALITLISLLVVIGPATWLAVGLIESIRAISGRLDLSTLQIPGPSMWIKDWPLIGDAVYEFWSNVSTDFKGALADLAPQLKPFGSSLLQAAAGAGTSILQFLVSIVVAGFLMPPAPTLVGAIKRLSSRLVSGRGEQFVALAAATIRTVSRGVVGISSLQALFAGVGVLLAGIPGAGLITSAVLILGIVQIGAGIILVPLVIWTWTTMPTTTALLFTAYMIPVSIMDNVLRPLVMGRGLQTPMLVILIGVLGGVIVHGFTGLFLGPIILAVIWELSTAWINERETTELASDPRRPAQA